MKKNMGNTDRVIRTLLAGLFGVLFFSGVVSGVFGIILLILAVVFLLTSLVGFCPLYVPLGISTCRAEDKKV
jgi:hypothetical protein